MTKTENGTWKRGKMTDGNTYYSRGDWLIVRDVQGGKTYWDLYRRVSRDHGDLRVFGTGHYDVALPDCGIDLADAKETGDEYIAREGLSWRD